MPENDPRIDAYIENSGGFARPVLNHLRILIHATCPEVTETVKWGFPHFEYKGSILCSMAAFKQHCALSFWLAAQMNDPHGLLTTGESRPAMGNFGRITTLADLPSDDILVYYLVQAMQLIDLGKRLQKKEPKPSSGELNLPGYFMDVLALHPTALETFERFSPSHRKEYVQWITEAKSEETRSKRIATAIEWLSEGKSRNWKYSR